MKNLKNKLKTFGWIDLVLWSVPMAVLVVAKFLF